VQALAIVRTLNRHDRLPFGCFWCFPRFDSLGAL
jgi:hypothetical protein